jgi:nitronate monooxygenase
MDLRDRLGLDVPVIQAGMGGGLSRADLAAAVSAAGALGTIGILPAPLLAAELRSAAERAPGRPIAVNLLMPFVTHDHVDVCVDVRPAVATLFCGHDAALVARLRDAGIFVLHQVGDAAAAKHALADGADGLIVQGVEAGGHVLATQPLESTLASVIHIAAGRPVLAAGGIVDATDVRAALDAGAAAVVAGTRFLLTEECHAHPAYQQRVLGASDTVVTRLFALGWRDPHRVVPNAAVRRWCHADGAVRMVPRFIAAATLPLARRVPMSAAAGLVARQRVGMPMFSPAALLRGDDPRLVEVTPLYAGTSAARIDTIVAAAEAVRLLTP